jgi:hypothetical protein
MTLEDRIALHRRMAEGYHEAYARRIERGRVQFPPEWRFAEAALYSSAYFGGGRDSPIGKMVNRPGVTISDGASREMRVYAAVLPDYEPVEFHCYPSPEGFVTKTLFVGHTAAGVRMQSWMIDFFLVDDAGLITRWETFSDGEDFGPIVELATGVRGPFPDFATYWRLLEQRLQALDAA